MRKRICFFRHSPFTGTNDEKSGCFGSFTRGSPLRIGQPRANFFNTFGVVMMARCARKKVKEFRSRCGRIPAADPNLESRLSIHRKATFVLRSPELLSSSREGNRYEFLD
jgi:hypothetical protein